MDQIGWNLIQIDQICSKLLFKYVPGFGSASNKPIDFKINEMLRLGFQEPCGGIFKRSKQIRPEVSMLGW